MTSNERTAKDSASTVPLWSPNAAANWSLIFSPVFGAYLHAKNWAALGDHERAAKSMLWFRVAVALLVVYAISGWFWPTSKADDGLTRLLGMVFLVSWYFGSARAQARYVKEKFGDSYVRRPWGKPLGYALLAAFCYLAVFVVVSVINEP